MPHNEYKCLLNEFTKAPNALRQVAILEIMAEKGLTNEANFHKGIQFGNEVPVFPKEEIEKQKQGILKILDL